MQYRKFLADRVFDGFQFLDGEQVVITNVEGEIQDIVGKDEAGNDIVLLNGVLTPGLINAHCHLELSHMKGTIPPHKGLINFLIGVVTKRGVIDEAIIQEKIAEAEEELYQNGVVAVADIVNTLHALATKKNSRLRWYNLIEVLNFFDQTFPERWKYNQDILAEHLKYQPGSVLTPHAPYTVSTGTFKEMNKATPGKIISIHNQETAAEDELFEKGTGDFLPYTELWG